MNKLEQAARQALDALEWGSIDADADRALRKQAITTLREALAERHKENCACEVCRGCYNADIKAEQAEGSIVKTCPDGYGTITTEQAEQEPVAWYSVKGGFNTCGEGKPLYAAPVRTKDLTDDEIDEIFAEYGTIPNTKAVRAVIAADREKNK